MTIRLITVRARMWTMVAVLVCGTLLLAQTEKRSATPKEVLITAKRYSFTPSEITLKKGEVVTLVFVSEDVTHGFFLPEWSLKAEIHKNHPVRLTFVPDKVGTFEARCSYFCGSGHGSMRLFYHVVD